MEFYIKLGQKYFRRFTSKHIAFCKNALQTTVLSFFFVNNFRFMAASAIKTKSCKFIRHYSQFQGYSNPALTGYVGNMVMNFVSNQGTGIEAPTRTFFLFTTSYLDFCVLKEKKYLVAARKEVCFGSSPSSI